MTQGHTAYAPFHIRSVTEQASKEVPFPKLAVRGYATIPNAQDLWGWSKRKDGSTKSFRSLFTEACIEDMRQQFHTRQLFVDGMHDIAANEGILNVLRSKGLSEDDPEYVEAQALLKRKKVPVGKLTKFDIDEKGVLIETETNPYFAMVDDDHKNYYNALIHSLQEDYLKGYSINFNPTDFVTELDENGDEMTRINKVDLYGYSYVADLPYHGNSFTEISIRSVKEVHEQRGESRMTEQDKKETQNDQTPSETPPQQQAPKESVDRAALEKEIRSKIELEHQVKEQQKMLDQLRAEQEKFAAQQQEHAGTGQRKGTTIEGRDEAAGTQQNELEKEYGFDPNKPDQLVQEIQKVASEFDRWKEERDRARQFRGKDEYGFIEPHGNFDLKTTLAQMIALQAQMRSHTRPLPGEDPKQYGFRQQLLAQGAADDIVVNRRHR